MHIPARGDYAVQAMLVIAAGDDGAELVSAGPMAVSQDIPLRFLHGILIDLVRADLLRSQRGSRGGYRLSRPAAEISVGQVLRAVAGELTSVRGLPLGDAGYRGAATGLGDFWTAVGADLERTLDATTLDDLARNPASQGRASIPSRMSSAGQRPRNTYRSQ